MTVSSSQSPPWWGCSGCPRIIALLSSSPPPPHSPSNSLSNLFSRHKYRKQPSIIQAVQMFRFHRPHPPGLPNVVARGDPRRRPVRALFDEIQIRTPVRIWHTRSPPVPRGLLSHIASARGQVAAPRPAHPLRGGTVARRPAAVDVVHIPRVDE